MRQLSISLVGILSIATLLSACDSDPGMAETDASSLARPAKLLQVGFAQDYALLSYPAVIDASQSSTLTFQVPGQLVELLVNEIDRVSEGDVLARLDSSDFQAQLTTARAQLDVAQTAYESAVRLSAEDAIAGNVLDQRKSDYDIRLASLDIAEKAFNDTRLIAPFAGVISDIPASVGDTIQPGNAVIALLGRGGLEATVNLPSSIVANSRSGESSAEVFVTLEAAPQIRIPAVFKEASLQADVGSQTFAITFSFAEPDDLTILPGMNASVWLNDPARSREGARISIPMTAVSVEGGELFVYLVDSESMLLSRRIITIEDDASSTLQVTSGLEPGDTIVVAGVSFLAEGMLVRPWSSN